MKLLGAGALGTALSPYLPLLSREAQAAEGEIPKRLLLVYSPHGTINSR